MRQLSQRVVATQEEERKNLSRELHDHVAQVLTGLRMELGRIERTTPSVSPAVAECKRLVDDMFGTVRNLALGLRPSMLDDFGLQAALEWHVRDFMRRYAIDVELRMEGEFDTLPEKYRTCVYRIVQEAMTNCARHAQAKAIRVGSTTDGGQLRIWVTDDGRGLNPRQHPAGLGLRGIEERVKELQGNMTIDQEPSGGTTISVTIPLPAAEISLARAAG
jgi:signal transduction histidine kinase